MESLAVETKRKEAARAHRALTSAQLCCRVQVGARACLQGGTKHCPSVVAALGGKYSTPFWNKVMYYPKNITCLHCMTSV